MITKPETVVIRTAYLRELQAKAEAYNKVLAKAEAYIEPACGVSWVICRDSDCNLEGPINDPHGDKWNSTPRRSEVAELLWLVDEFFEGNVNHIDLQVFCEKMEREWKL